MEDVTIINPKNDNLLNQFLALYSSLKGKRGSSFNFILNEIDWICPLLILPLSAYIKTTSSKYTIGISKSFLNYLKFIKFPNGIESVSDLQNSILKNKTYIPISIIKRDSIIDKERIEGIFSELIYTNIGAIYGAKSAIIYPILELVNNIFEHSKSDVGFIFGQNYPQKEYLDICIIDRGRGVRKAYEEENDLKLTDSESIREVLRGKSTKIDKERGYGVRTSKRIICEALKGQFIIISGSAALFSDCDSDKLFDLPDFDWQGVIISFRIPKPKAPIDISPYLE